MEETRVKQNDRPQGEQERASAPQPRARPPRSALRGARKGRARRGGRHGRRRAGDPPAEPAAAAPPRGVTCRELARLGAALPPCQRGVAARLIDERPVSVAGAATRGNAPCIIHSIHGSKTNTGAGRARGGAQREQPCGALFMPVTIRTWPFESRLTTRWMGVSGGADAAADAHAHATRARGRIASTFAEPRASSGRGGAGSWQQWKVLTFPILHSCLAPSRPDASTRRPSRKLFQTPPSSSSAASSSSRRVWLSAAP